jgi:hypothetical protein
MTMRSGIVSFPDKTPRQQLALMLFQVLIKRDTRKGAKN